MGHTNTTISLQRATRNSDGAGGKTESWANVATGLAAGRRFYKGHDSTLTRNETPSGVVTEYDTLFVLTAGAATVRVNDRVVDADGVIYTVKYVRPYTRTLQLDTRRMQ